MYFINHTKKEWLFIGKGDGNNVMFVFNLYNWSTKDDIRMYYDNTRFQHYTNPQYQEQLVSNR
jgi:formate-dependent nitrite reductase cytochrome c552 subunit